jgi:parvulin-like peptidyl-prolyl isomerase
MAKRKKAVEEERELTRKEVRLRARARERNRRLYLGTGIALGLALLAVAVGAVLQFGVRPRSAVVTVGPDRIITSDFWRRIDLERWQLQNQLFQMQQLEAQFGQGVFGQQISQIQSTLASPGALGLQVLDRMIDEKVVEQQAAARNITVTDEEVAAALREEIANSRGALSEPQATATSEADSAATATAASWTPTPAPTLDVSSTVTATATALPTPEPLATRPIISDTGYTEGIDLLTENLNAVGGLSIDDYRSLIRARLLAEKLQTVIGEEQVTATEEQVRARHLLLRIPEPPPTDTLTNTLTAPLTATTPLTDLATLTATEELTIPTEITATTALTAADEITESTAITTTDTVTGAGSLLDKSQLQTEEQVRAFAEELRRQIQNGADFATLAQQYSDDSSNASTGGDLGWFGRGRMVAAFEEAAFSLPLNEVSEPIKTDFGYHLIEVLEKDANRQKDEAQLEQERQQAYQTWLQEQKTATAIERPEDINDYLPR